MDMNFQCEVVRRAEPDPSGIMTVRAVRPDGNVLIQEQGENHILVHTFGYAISGGPGVGFAVGEYEWQQLLGDGWVTLSRYKVA